MTFEELTGLILRLCDTLIDEIMVEDEDEDTEDIITLLRGSSDKRRIQVEIKVIDEEREENDR